MGRIDAQTFLNQNTIALILLIKINRIFFRIFIGIYTTLK
jgi:hypothetical protein